MSTRANICQEYADGSVRVIYLHSDGYPEYAGHILKKFYKTPDDVTNLINLGDLSQIDTETDHCVAYSRDRGEPFEDVEPRTYDSMKEYLSDIAFDIDWVYTYNMESERWTIARAPGLNS